MTDTTTDVVDYAEFLRAKIDYSYQFGYTDGLVDPINPMLFPHQQAIVKWCIEGGRRAVFANFGLGKTVIALEVVRITRARAGGRGLIICPLGVRQEFRRDAKMLGIETRFVRWDHEVGPADEDVIYLTNYESVRDGRLDPNQFTVVSLDEASCLRSYGSKTFITFLAGFSDVPYKFVATATPSPNRYKELIHYAGFLGILDTGSALTRFFQRDSTQANNLTLYPHKEQEFWLWLSSWAIFLQKPSDLGFGDTGYNMPTLEVVYHEVAVDPFQNVYTERDGTQHLFRDGALGVVGASKEKRDTLPTRIAKMKEIVDESPDDHFILWHDLEDERRAIKQALPEAVEVYGTLDLDIREDRIIAFSDGDYRLLATKPQISGSGCNFQRHCHRAIFTGIGFDFNEFIQAIHRIQRFGQTEPVRIDVIYAESERSVLETLKRKWKQHEELQAIMSNVIREHGLNQVSIEDALRLSIGVERVEISGEGWQVVNNDCVAECATMPDQSVDLIVTSIPFGNQYGYVNAVEDFGHTDNNDHFWAQMDYLTPNLKRILKPGRMYCCHVKDRILFGNQYGTGAPTVSPFHAEAMMHGIKHGFDFMGMITVVTDVVRENNQTYRLGWTEHSKDATKMGVGCPEYILLFRCPQTDRSKGYADTPVAKTKDDYSRARWQVDAHAFWRSSGNRPLTAEDLKGMPTGDKMKAFSQWTLDGVYDYEAHIRIGEEIDVVKALPATFMMLAPASESPTVWTDINRMRTANTDQKRNDLELHVCPLQFDIVDRLIDQYSMPGEIVFDPFGGLATVPVRAMRKGRIGHSVELSPSYFMDGVRYCQIQERKMSAPSLFDLFDLETEIEPEDVGDLSEVSP